MMGVGPLDVIRCAQGGGGGSGSGGGSGNAADGFTPELQDYIVATLRSSSSANADEAQAQAGGGARCHVWGPIGLDYSGLDTLTNANADTSTSTSTSTDEAVSAVSAAATTVDAAAEAAAATRARQMEVFGAQLKAAVASKVSVCLTLRPQIRTDRELYLLAEKDLVR